MHRLAIGSVLLVALACGDGGEGAMGDECNPESSNCEASLRCVELMDATFACHLPVEVRGDVVNAFTGAPIDGAHVIALDGVPVAVSDVAVSDIDGRYSLEIPWPRAEDGSPAVDNHTLRASADGYETFPSGVRRALPISADSAAEIDGTWVIENTSTRIALLELEDTASARASIRGTVQSDRGAGVLVVAEGPSTRTAVSDLSGGYTIFNLPPGDYDVRGYAADLQLTPESVTLGAEPAVGVDLVEASSPELGSLSGNISIVNAPGGSATSVVLVVESTFIESLGRGEVPPGLRAPRTGVPSINGAFTIEGIPQGDYVVLAGFENDQLVRDPDELIAGTGFVRVSIPGTTDLAEGFKVTEALDVIGPGRDVPEPVTEAPVLEWADDSSEEYYEVVVLDAFGNLAWETTVPGVSGSDTVQVTYEGPLETGMYYQFRATSFRMPGGGAATPIAATEDLRGVFYVP